MRRERWHRTVFIAAGMYNLVWGAYAIIDPQWIFRLAKMPALNHPQVFACLGMVIGVYGLLYLEVARRTQRGWAIAVVGLIGKVLGPIGMMVAIVKGDWPASALLFVCITNDFIWWIPFAMYLRDAWPAYRTN